MNNATCKRLEIDKGKVRIGIYDWIDLDRLIVSKRSEKKRKKEDKERRVQGLDI